MQLEWEDAGSRILDISGRFIDVGGLRRIDLVTQQVAVARLPLNQVYVERDSSRKRKSP